MKGLVTSLIALLCLLVFTSTFASGGFPALLPEIGRSQALHDWQLGAVAGAFGFARMLADVPIGLFLTHHLRRALVLGPRVIVAGLLLMTTSGSFSLLVLGRLLLGVGHALVMMASLTALLRFGAGLRLASSLNAFEFSAMLGFLGGTLLVGLLPVSVGWSTAILLASAPMLLGVAALPALLRALPAAGAATYSTIEQFMLPLRGSRTFDLERAGIARLLMTMQISDVVALLPVGLLADRVGAPRVLGVVLLLMAAATVLVAFGALPVVAAGCALFGVAMAGWMLPLGVLRRETAPERIAWRTGLYRVFVDGGMFLGPFVAGLVGARLAPHLGAVCAVALAVTGALFLAGRR
jgi:MFS family permease